jgi:hypothetical protein
MQPWKLALRTDSSGKDDRTGCERSSADLFNVLNNAGQVAQNWQTRAATFGRITSLEAPRVARLGAEFSF